MRQTTRINGKRSVITTSAKTGRVTVKGALPLEWELQAAQVRALRHLPAYGRRFLLAGDQNAAKRGPRATAQAVAAGMTKGELDLRIYAEGARLLMIENKVGKARLQPEQIKRHAELTKLGFDVRVLRAVTPDDAAAQAVAMVLGFLEQGDV